eukprot:gene5933-biopygen5397
MADVDQMPSMLVSQGLLCAQARRSGPEYLARLLEGARVEVDDARPGGPEPVVRVRGPLAVRDDHMAPAGADVPVARVPRPVYIRHSQVWDMGKSNLNFPGLTHPAAAKRPGFKSRQGNTRASCIETFACCCPWPHMGVTIRVVFLFGNCNQLPRRPGKGIY